jgi:hypothetical protein
VKFKLKGMGKALQREFRRPCQAPVSRTGSNKRSVKNESQFLGTNLIARETEDDESFLFISLVKSLEAWIRGTGQNSETNPPE